VRKELIVTHRTNLDSNCEILWTEIKLHKQPSLFTGVFYRTKEDKHGLRIDALNESLLKIGDKINKSNVLLLGDFNLPNVVWPSKKVISMSGYSTQAAEKLLNLAEEHGLHQFVTKPTRNTSTCSNLLDLAFTNNANKVCKVENRDGIADHDNVWIEMSLTPIIKRKPRRKVYIRKKANLDGILKDLTAFGEKYFNECIKKPADDKWIAISSAILQAMETHVPQRLTKPSFDLPWFSRQLRRDCRRKQRRYNRAKKSGKPEDWEQFRQCRKDFSKKIRAAKAKYIGEHLGEALEENPKAFWSFVKNLRQENLGVPALKEDDNILSESIDKAELLNKQFTSVFTKETGEPPAMDSTPIQKEIAKLKITTEGVEKLLLNLDPSKSSGADNIPPWFLRLAAKPLAPLLTDLFQTSVDTGEVPVDWKKANITALFKKGEKTDPGNYRPVSLTSVICKTLEHIIHSHIMKHLDANSILNDNQHGFRAKRSTESQLILTIEDIASSLNTSPKTSVDVGVLDFSKAFDKVPHNRLSHKLHHYGIRGALLRWIRNFLTNREQCVVIDGSKSQPSDVISGVPQGTVLGPLMFLLYINDLPNSLDSECRLFADDCLVYKVIKTPADIDILQKDFMKLEQWQNKWLMSFNPKKCCVVSFGSKGIPNHEYVFCGEKLGAETSNPYLGVQLANTLEWDIQTQHATKKAQQILGIVKRNLWSCPEKVKTTAYLTLVRPHLEYGTAAWCPYKKTNKAALERVQRQAARFCKRDYSREPGSMTRILQEPDWEH
jgi:hypothetical protein